MKQKVLRIGSSAGITLSKDALTSLGVGIGDSIDVRIDESGEVTLLPRASDANRAKRITELTLDFIARYRKDLEALSRK